MYTFHFENAADVALWIETMRVSTCAKVLGRLEEFLVEHIFKEVVRKSGCSYLEWTQKRIWAKFSGVKDLKREIKKINNWLVILDVPWLEYREKYPGGTPYLVI